MLVWKIKPLDLSTLLCTYVGENWSKTYLGPIHKGNSASKDFKRNIQRENKASIRKNSPKTTRNRMTRNSPRPNTRKRKLSSNPVRITCYTYINRLNSLQYQFDVTFKDKTKRVIKISGSGALESRNYDFCK